MYRNYSASDYFLFKIDHFLRIVAGQPLIPDPRPYPAENIPEHLNLEKERHYAGRLMRINHTGEVCAQALYKGQAWVAQHSYTQHFLQKAITEEAEHLAWCQKRLEELGSHTSYLNPVWYIGSWCIGVFAGIAGDRWNFGFLRETENQVSLHLQKHLDKLPIKDRKSFAILYQMKLDEEQHAKMAEEAGGVILFPFLKKGMQWSAKIMTSIAYFV